MIDLNPADLEIVKRILAEHVPGCEVRAFGSRVTWTAKEYSDLDLAIVCDKPLGLSTLGNLREAFEESDLPIRVDVLDWQSTAESFQRVIEKKFEVLQGGQGKRTAQLAGWRECTLGDVIELKRGYDLPKQDRRPGTVPLVSSSGITDQHAEAMARGPGVVTGRYGTLGEVFYLDEDFWPLNTTLYVRDFKGNDPRFISYFLRQVDFLAYSDKAAVPGLNRNHLHQANVRFPSDLAEQRAIATTLGALDDKIEVNRRMNETLEAMARALFKSWFIDFDPVRAKMAGRAPAGIDTDTAALFPNELVGSDLGPRPVGWRFTCLGEVLELKRGYDLPVSARGSGKVPIVSSSGFSGFHSVPKVRGPGVVTGRYGTIGQVYLVWEDFWPLNTALYVTDFKTADVFYVLYLLRSLDFDKFSDKGAVPGINRNHVHLERICEAPESLQQRFHVEVGPWLSLVRSNQAESKTLEALRDVLLPKLLSGELRIPDAEREIEKVA